MTARIVAEAWRELVERKDIDIVIYELIGRYEVSIIPPHKTSYSEERLKRAMQAVSQLKLILDLQRTYLQSLDGREELDSFRINTNLLISILLYLNQLKTLIQTRAINIATNGRRNGDLPDRMFDKISAEDRTYRFLIAQTILSGVRALLLQTKPSMHPELKQLSQALLDTWSDVRSTEEIEDFIIHRLCVGSLDQVLSEIEDGIVSPLLCSPCCGHHDIKLPRYSTGLYIGIDSNDTLKNLVNKVKDLDASRPLVEDLTIFWTLFDYIWACEANFIQSSPHDSDFSSCEHKITRDSIKSLLNRPDTFQRAFYDNQALKTLESTLFGWCNTVQLYLNDNLMDARQQLLLRPLAALSKLLLDRRNMLQGPSYGATEASARWHPEVTTWLRNESDLTSEQIRELGQKCVPIYIVNCPSLHPVPGAMLRNRNTRLQEPANQTNLLKLDMICPMCNAEHPKSKITWARLVEPLGQGSIDTNGTSTTDRQQDLGHFRFPSGISLGSSNQHDTLQNIHTISNTPSFKPSEEESLNTYPRGQHRRASRPYSRDQSISIKSNPESIYRGQEDEESSAAASITPSTTSSTKNPPMPWLRKMFSSTTPEKPQKEDKKTSDHSSTKTTKTKNPQRRLLYRFSASGTILILWYRNGNGIAIFDTASMSSSDSGRKLDVENIRLVAGGDQKVAVISGALKNTKLSIHHGSSSILDVAIPEFDAGEAKRKCIAVSQDDKYVATGIGGEINVYMISEDSVSLCRTICPDQIKPMDDLLLGFSVVAPQSHRIVVAARSDNAQGLVSVSVSEIETQDQKKAPLYQKHYYLARKTGDFGLTSVSYSETFGQALLTSCVSDSDGALVFPTRSRDVIPLTNLPNIIHGVQCAAQNPLESSYAIVTAESDLIMVDIQASGSHKVENIVRLRKQAHLVLEDLMIIALPEDNLVLTFWVKETAMIVTKIVINKAAASKMARQYDIRQQFDLLEL